MSKPRVKIQHDSQHGEYSKNDVGIVDGYVRGGDNRPYAVVILKRSKKVKQVGTFVMVPLNSIEIDDE